MILSVILSIMLLQAGCGFHLARSVSCCDKKPVSIYIQRPMNSSFADRYSAFLDALRDEFIQNNWIVCNTQLGSDYQLAILEQKNQRELLAISDTGDQSQELIHNQIRVRLTHRSKKQPKIILLTAQQSQIFPVLAHDPIRESALQASNLWLSSQKLAQKSYRQISRVILKLS